MARTGFISLVIEQELKNILDKLAEKKHTTRTYILEKALMNYFKATKVLTSKPICAKKNYA